MIKKKIIVQNESGLHARPSATLVKLASKFESDFFIQMQGYKINGKSILGVMTLAADFGSELELITDGKDEVEAIEALSGLFDNKFNLET